MLFFLFPETYPIQVLWLNYDHFLSCWHPQSCWLISLIVSLFQFYKNPDLILLLSKVTSQPSFSPPPGALASNLPWHSGQRLSWNPVIIPPCPEKQNHSFFLWMEAAVSCSEIPQAIPQKQYFLLVRLIIEIIGFRNLQNVLSWITIHCNICV